MLFRIAFMIDQKDVGNVYARLAGLKIFNAEPPLPVQMENGGGGGGPRGGLIPEDLIKGRSQITTTDIAAALSASGRSPKSVSYVISALKEKGLVKKSKVRGTWTVVGGAR